MAGNDGLTQQGLPVIPETSTKGSFRILRAQALEMKELVIPCPCVRLCVFSLCGYNHFHRSNHLLLPTFFQFTSQPG